MCNCNLRYTFCSNDTVNLQESFVCTLTCKQYPNNKRLMFGNKVKEYYEMRSIYSVSFNFEARKDVFTLLDG